jgi:hypothetical protein
MNKKELEQHHIKTRSSLVMQAIQDNENGEKYPRTLLHTDSYDV